MTEENIEVNNQLKNYPVHLEQKAPFTTKNSEAELEFHPALGRSSLAAVASSADTSNLHFRQAQSIMEDPSLFQGTQSDMQEIPIMT